MSPQQQVRSRYGLTYITACMTGALWYILLINILHLHVLSFGPWFVLFLAGMVPASTLGAFLVARPSGKRDRETLDRLLTGVSGALLVLGFANGLIQFSAATIRSPIDTMGLLLLLAFTALGATFGTHPTFSETIWSRILQVSRRAIYMHWIVELLVIILGGMFGYLITVGTTSVGSTILGILAGLAVTVAFISHLNHLLTLYRRP